jgi:hypothetical protein
MLVWKHYKMGDISIRETPKFGWIVLKYDGCWHL